MPSENAKIPQKSLTELILQVLMVVI